MDPATLPEMGPPTRTKETEGEERRIELSEIIGLPDFDVSSIQARPLGRLSRHFQAVRPIEPPTPSVVQSQTSVI